MFVQATLIFIFSDTRRLDSVSVVSLGNEGTHIKCALSSVETQYGQFLRFYSSAG